jgi:hypothetical protein
MDPHKRTLRFPFFENIAFGKPRGRTAMMSFASNIFFDLPTDLWHQRQKFSCDLSPTKLFQPLRPELVSSGDYERSILFTLTAISCMRTRGPSYKVVFDYTSQMDIPRLGRISSVDALPSTELVFRTMNVLIRL